METEIPAPDAPRFMPDRHLRLAPMTLPRRSSPSSTHAERPALDTFDRHCAARYGIDAGGLDRGGRSHAHFRASGRSRSPSRCASGLGTWIATRRWRSRRTSIIGVLIRKCASAAPDSVRPRRRVGGCAVVRLAQGGQLGPAQRPTPRGRGRAGAAALRPRARRRDAAAGDRARNRSARQRAASTSMIHRGRAWRWIAVSATGLYWRSESVRPGGVPEQPEPEDLRPGEVS